MTIKAVEGVISNAIRIMQTFLPAELDIIDGEMSDGLTMEDVPNERYFDYELDETYIPQGPSITITPESTTGLSILSTTNSPGLDRSEHRVIVGVHVKDSGNEGPSSLRKRCLRYERAIVRVLCIKYPTFPNAGLETVTVTEVDGDITYKDTGQEGGQYVRSARVPLRIRTYESL
ncbi:MAG TPA: hypothetical protein VKD72_12500 [Gemmataceae bacterium]|nr:hypothetical protein [Gemmataceae bacterium]